MSNVVVLSKPFIRPLERWDIFELSKTMRQEDVDEVYHSSRVSPMQALTQGAAASSICLTVERAGRVVAILGIVGETDSIGSPWMLASDDLVNCKSLLRECRRMVQRWTLQYNYLTNHCWSRNTVHIEWLKWLGFTFSGEEIRNGETFLQFHKGTYV